MKKNTMNPKDRIGIKKTPLHLIPGSSLVHVAEALKNGADKYGPYNWRDEKIRATVYISACLRHIHAWLDGEEVADDSKLSHIAHAAAGLLILLDAQDTGNIYDDRPTKGKTAEILKKYRKHD